MEKIEDHFNSLVGRAVTRANPGFGSFFSLDFGKDIENVYSTKQGMRSFTCGEWHLWIQMAFWNIEEKGKIILSDEDEKETFFPILKKLENKKLKHFEITSDAFDMTLLFEGDIKLFVIANNEEDDYVQWCLFTPKGKVFVAGPGKKLTYEDE